MRAVDLGKQRLHEGHYKTVALQEQGLTLLLLSCSHSLCSSMIRRPMPQIADEDYMVGLVSPGTLLGCLPIHEAISSPGVGTDADGTSKLPAARLLSIGIVPYSL